MNKRKRPRPFSRHRTYRPSRSPPPPDRATSTLGRALADQAVRAAVAKALIYIGVYVKAWVLQYPDLSVVQHLAGWIDVMKDVLVTTH